MTTLDYSRVRSTPFSYVLPATDNLYQFFGYAVKGTVAPAVADGYFSFIPGTLPPGFYLLQFGGGSPINDQGNTFSEKITYRLTVVP